VTIRGPNRMTDEDAEKDMDELKKKAEEVGPAAASKEVRSLSTQMQRQWEREKHIATGRQDPGA